LTIDLQAQAVQAFTITVHDVCLVVEDPRMMRLEAIGGIVELYAEPDFIQNAVFTNPIEG
jgi:hypothetical protein